MAETAQFTTEELANNPYGFDILSSVDPDTAYNIIQLNPILFATHKRWPADIIFLDLVTMQYLFDQTTGELKRELTDNKHAFWTEDRPYPINAINNDDALLEYWKPEQITAQNRRIYTQDKDTVQKMIAHKNADTENNILILVKTPKKAYVVLTMYLIKIMHADKKNVLQTVENI